MSWIHLDELELASAADDRGGGSGGGGGDVAMTGHAVRLLRGAAAALAARHAEAGCGCTGGAAGGAAGGRGRCGFGGLHAPLNCMAACYDGDGRCAPPARPDTCPTLTS